MEIAACLPPPPSPSVSSSQSPECCCRAQGDGWSAISSSSSVFRAARTFSEFVDTFIPGSTGRTHDALSTRASCIHHTKPANTDRRLILQMAQRRNRNPIQARGIIDGRARRHLHRLPVDRQFHQSCRHRIHFGVRRLPVAFTTSILRSLRTPLVPPNTNHESPAPNHVLRPYPYPCQFRHPSRR